MAIARALHCFTGFSIAAVVVAPATSAQKGATVYGRVVELDDGRPIAEVSVLIPGTDLTTVTSQDGRFSLRAIPFGRHEIRFERLGYVTRVDSMTVGEGRPVDITVSLTAKPVELPPIEATVRSAALERAGFYDRRQYGPQGTVFTAADIERLSPVVLTDIVRRAPATVIVDGGPGRKILRFNREPSARPGSMPGCEPAVFLDGIMIQDQPGGEPRLLDFNRVSPAEVEAVEIFVGANVPVQYKYTACGAVLIWTKR